MRGPKLTTVLKVYWIQTQSLPWACWPHYFCCTEMPLVLLVTCTHCWLMFSQLLTNTPRSFSSEQFSIHFSPGLYHCMGLLWPKCGIYHFPLLNALQLDASHWSRLFRSLCAAFLHSSRSMLSPNLVLSVNLLRVHSIPPSVSLMKILKKTG